MFISKPTLGSNTDRLHIRVAAVLYMQRASANFTRCTKN
uniref:Uncharacterized protein n=1 Tax=Arundo donax TaxID=35708 RepID=A0A0A9GM88_ARUDO